MDLTADNFYETVDSFIRLPGVVADLMPESFQRVYASDQAYQHREIVYLLCTEKRFPRLKGDSSILYIGQTKHSYAARHLGTIKWVTTTQANKIKYEHVINEYGPLHVRVSHYSPFGGSPLQAEAQLLWWYFQNHCEYPPFNYTKTKYRNDMIHTEIGMAESESFAHQ